MTPYDSVKAERDRLRASIEGITATLDETKRGYGARLAVEIDRAIRARGAK